MAGERAAQHCRFSSQTDCGSERKTHYTDSKPVQTLGQGTQGIIDTWENQTAGHWDRAIRGSSALRTALRRELGHEVATLLGVACCGIYYDLSRFYDSIDPVQLARKALGLNFHPVSSHSFCGSDSATIPAPA